MTPRQPIDAREPPMTQTWFVWSTRTALCALASALLMSCGGSDGGSPPPPAAPPPTIGSAGGTVTGPAGAQVVIPAGALAANTAIAVDQSSAGSPALPAGMNAFGSMFAFTPHGTSFAMPVTVTVPFNAASVPAGATPALYKTNAAGGWERVAGASVNAATITAQVTSFSWIIVGNVPPQITTQPTNVSVVEPATATFTVTAIGTPPFTYQWQRSDDAGVNFNPIAGATAASYTTPATSIANDNGDRYRVLVSNLEGTSTSQAATLTVTANIVAPAITTQPQNQTVAVGANATFTAAASGTNPTYQWQRSSDGINFANVAGATNASYTLANAQATDNNARLRVIASNAAGTATSNAATLTVTAAIGSLAIDAFEIAGPPARLPPPTQTGQFGSFTPAAAVTCVRDATTPTLLHFAAGNAAGTQAGRFNLQYDTVSKQVRSVGYASPRGFGDEFRYMCVSPSPAPQIRACAGVTVDEVGKTFTFVDTVLDFDFPSFVVPTPSDIRLNGTLNVPTCFP
jgi:hypothetical protein